MKLFTIQSIHVRGASSLPCSTFAGRKVPFPVRYCHDMGLIDNLRDGRGLRFHRKNLCLERALKDGQRYLYLFSNTLSDMNDTDPSTEPSAKV